MDVNLVAQTGTVSDLKPDGRKLTKYQQKLIRALNIQLIQSFSAHIEPNPIDQLDSLSIFQILFFFPLPLISVWLSVSLSPSLSLSLSLPKYI